MIIIRLQSDKKKYSPELKEHVKGENTRTRRLNNIEKGFKADGSEPMEDYGIGSNQMEKASSDSFGMQQAVVLEKNNIRFAFHYNGNTGVSPRTAELVFEAMKTNFNPLSV